MHCFGVWDGLWHWGPVLGMLLKIPVCRGLWAEFTLPDRWRQVPMDER